MPNYPKAFTEACKASKQMYPELGDLLLAWFWFESGGGKSKLSKKANNISGLKYRDLSPYIDREVWNRVEMLDYTDWENKSDPYLKLLDPWDFPIVFIGFLSRPVYLVHTTPIPTKAPDFYYEDCMGLMNHCLLKGYCGAISGVHRNDYPDGFKYREAIRLEYISRVLKVYYSQKFRNFLEALNE